jgi:MinD-like ATPase involved in chromosome partitioning or flagellar assembly
MQQRLTLFGLVGRTASWPQHIEAWATADTVPFRVSYCRSVAHLRARLDASDHACGVLLDGDLSFVDRDLLTALASAGGVAIVAAGARRRRPWPELGAAAVLPLDFDRDQLLEAVRDVVDVPVEVPARPAASLIAVTGPGGTGASVTAIALAQGLAAARRRVLLADCCLHAEQAMLHNAHGTQPNVADVVEHHAGHTPEPREVRQLALGIVERGYYLLPGIARARHWSRIPEASLRAAMHSLRAAFDVVVADVDVDVEGEEQGGSLDVEERNVLARTVIGDADAVMVVGQPTMKGVYATVRAMVELLEFGVPPGRLLPVINRATTDPAVRADLSRAVSHLMGGVVGGGTAAVAGMGSVGPVLFAPCVVVEERLRERDTLDDAWPSLLAGAVTAMLDRVGERPATKALPEPVAAGSLGHWAGAEDGT